VLRKEMSLSGSVEVVIITMSRASSTSCASGEEVLVELERENCRCR
jgi:hypothetical protein